MGVTVDQLNIELTANSQKAKSAIEELSQTLVKLQSSLGNLVNVNVKVSNSFNNKTTNIQKASKAIDDHAKKTKEASNSIKKFTDRMAQQISKTRTLVGAFKSVANTMADWFKESNDYIETLNLFNVTMGEGSDEAREFAESVSNLMGIDPKEWMQYQGIFKNLTSGFGVASDKANIMSQNLTQLSYDMASFFNPTEGVVESFDKLSSAMSGQVKGLREYGIDTTVATLQEYALSRGIDASVRSMSQAEKSLLRYNYIMEQSRDLGIWNDMARTIVTPANSLRILNAQLTQMKRALGNIVSVIVVQFIPYVQALVEIIKDAANAIATFFGFDAKSFEADIPDFDDNAWGIEDAEESLDGVSGSLKKIKKQLMGFDELNLINNPESDSAGGVGGASGGAGLDLEPIEYNFLEGLDTSRVEELKEKMKDILAISAEIAAGFLVWKLSKHFLNTVESLAVALGVILVIDSVRKVITDGISWGTVIEGAIGGALIGAGIGFKLGGVPGAIGGLTIGIGVSLLITGITSVITEGANVENIVSIISGALATIGGIIGVIKWFNKSHASPTADMETATTTIGETNTGTNKLATKLKELATTLAWGVVIIAEVAAAAIIVVGAIAILGKELQAVDKAWDPVLKNGKNVKKAIASGTTILVAVGAVATALGKAGKTLAADIAVGTAMLALVSVATDLFLIEIVIIGELLQQIITSWQPVLDNGETVASGIALGTTLLVGIGVVTALLGAATVASAGALPLAIGLGTALLVELGAAFVLFVNSLVDVATKLSDNLAPVLRKLNDKLPTLTTDMEDFTDFMEEFALAVVEYTACSAIAGIAATIGKVIDFFTTDPIQTLSDEVSDQNDQFDDLIKNLEDCIPDIEYAIDLVKEYNDLMEEFSKESGGDEISILTFLTDIVTGVWDTIKETINSIIGGIEKMANGVIDGINGMINALNSLKFKIPDWVPTYGGKELSLGLKTIDQISIPRLASGGIVDEGQMFIAREAGPELVGTIGNKTAVANNDQIIGGIEAGVYRAMMAANSMNQGGSYTIRIINEIDGDVVGEKVIEFHNDRVMQTGVSPLLI